MSSTKSVTDLRVLAGEFKGRKLLSPRSEHTHPMGAREKNALFNMIQPYLPGARVLDLFAGSGALGIEALSRGAAEVIFVEKNPQIAAIIRKNLASIDQQCPQNAAQGSQQPLGAPDRAYGCNTKVLTEDALKIACTGSYAAEFDLILVDPPYDGFTVPTPVSAQTKGFSGIKSAFPEATHGHPSNNLVQSLPLILSQLPTLIAPGGHLVLSSPATLPAPAISGLKLLTTRTYARARLTVYALSDEN